MIRLFIQVITIVDHLPIEMIQGTAATWEGTQVIKSSDKYRELNPDGPAEQRVDIEEKISGPSGTYSSVSVRIGSSVRCDQDEKSIRTARDLLVSEIVSALETYLPPSMDLLLSHVGTGKK